MPSLSLLSCQSVPYCYKIEMWWIGTNVERLWYFCSFKDSDMKTILSCKEWVRITYSQVVTLWHVLHTHTWPYTPIRMDGHGTGSRPKHWTSLCSQSPTLVRCRKLDFPGLVILYCLQPWHFNFLSIIKRLCTAAKMYLLCEKQVDSWSFNGHMCACDTHTHTHTHTQAMFTHVSLRTSCTFTARLLVVWVCVFEVLFVDVIDLLFQTYAVLEWQNPEQRPVKAPDNEWFTVQYSEVQFKGSKWSLDHYNCT